MKYITVSQDKFIWSAFKERYYLKENKLKHSSNYTFNSIEGYDKYDVSFTMNTSSGAVDCIGEIKIRDIKASSFATSFLEKEKYDALMQEYHTTGRTPFYIMFYKDSVVVYYNLLKFQHIKPVYEDCPAQTRGNNQTKAKLIMNLPITQGISLRYAIPDNAKMITDYNRFYTIKK